MSSENSFFSNQPKNCTFVVKNTCSDKRKVIKIFNYPILPGDSRDLLAIPGISVADIKGSLLKGVLNFKIRANDIEIIACDIDLLEFNEEQKQFLIAAGVSNLKTVDPGLSGGSTSNKLYYLWREEIPLIGLKNNSNRTFYTPDKFVNGLTPEGDQFHIHIKHNGRDLYEGIDYTIGESSGLGTGYDTISIFSFAPDFNCLLYSTYVVRSP